MSKQTVNLKVSGIKDNKAIKEIKNSTNKIRGVISVSVSKDSKNVAVDYDDTGTEASRIVSNLENTGYEVSIVSQNEHLM